MDRNWAKPWESSGRVGDLPAGFTLPSRVAALHAIVPALRSQAGLVLVTGDAGTGKTWLLSRIRADLPTSWRTVRIELTPANDPVDFYRLIGHALGLAEAKGLVAARLDLADFLQENAADGIHWILAIDEAQGLALDIFEELRVLSNRLGGPDGFAGLILIGQTALARRLASRPLSALAGRIAVRAHLRPLDLDEAQALLERSSPNLSIPAEALERLHRETGGNPTGLLNANRQRRPIAPIAHQAKAPPIEIEATPSVTNEVRPPANSAPRVPSPAEEPKSWDGPVLGQGKPPLRVEDGLIEVGWEPDSEMELGLESEAEAELGSELAEHSEHEEYAPDLLQEQQPHVEPLSEETIQDRYTALQAWNEWARNQGRTPSVEPDERAALAGSSEADVDLELVEGRNELASSAPGVRAEGQQSFAPYSQLFTRLKQRRETS